MTGRRWVWAGAGITAVAVAGLGVYFAVVGLDRADKVASVVGALAALVGLAVAAYGLVGTPPGTRPELRRVTQRGRVSGRGRVVQVGGDQTAHHSAGGAGGAGGSSRVNQDAEATGDGTISQIGGDQDPPAAP